VQNKILVIRFSSIGDIVLTTPVIRCLNQQIHAEVHVVVKEQFKSTLAHNPYIHTLHTFKKDVDEIYDQLMDEKFTAVIDLHKNLRSLRLKRKLGVKSYAFDKINLEKYLAVNFKYFKLLPAKHIVERYFQTVSDLGVKDDGRGLDYFLNEAEKVDVHTLTAKQGAFVSLVIGGSLYTKKIPPSKLFEICTNLQMPIVLLGGAEDAELGIQLAEKFQHVTNACGKLNINQSASVIEQSDLVITSDTGLMHIAAAFNKKIISVWGNTIPEFGMGPYNPASQNLILEVADLPCRPCSKLGYDACPLGHFKCMNEIDYSFLREYN
jgi:ADP-heptose:LPS heptosyltransferase